MMYEVHALNQDLSWLHKYMLFFWLNSVWGLMSTVYHFRSIYTSLDQSMVLAC